MSGIMVHEPSVQPLSHEGRRCGVRRMAGGRFNSRSGVRYRRLRKCGTVGCFQDQAGVWVCGPGHSLSLLPYPSQARIEPLTGTMLTPRHTGIQATSCLGN